MASVIIFSILSACTNLLLECFRHIDVLLLIFRCFLYLYSCDRVAWESIPYRSVSFCIDGKIKFSSRIIFVELLRWTERCPRTSANLIRAVGNEVWVEIEIGKGLVR